MTELIKDIYSSLMERGWKLPEIDAMDMVYYMELRAYDLINPKNENNQTAYIDQIGIF